MIHDHKQHGLVLMDGKEVRAKARRIPHLGAYRFSWTDPAARKPNVAGVTNPALVVVRTKREAFAKLKGVQ